MLCWIVAANMLAASAGARAQGLKVETIPFPESEGGSTTHGLSELRLSSGHGMPLVLRYRGDGEEVMIPYPGPQLSVGREHVLLLGWSSVGSGTNTLHALLLHLTPDGVVLEHNLKLTLARWQAALVVRRVDPDAVLVGIPEWWKAGGSFETSLALGKGWGESLRELRPRSLRFVATEEQSTDTYYDPPFFPAAGLAPARKAARAAGRRISEIPELPERVAWLRVTRDGLAWTGSR